MPHPKKKPLTVFFEALALKRPMAETREDVFRRFLIDWLPTSDHVRIGNDCGRMSVKLRRDRIPWSVDVRACPSNDPAKLADCCIADISRCKDLEIVNDLADGFLEAFQIWREADKRRTYSSRGKKARAARTRKEQKKGELSRSEGRRLSKAAEPSGLKTRSRKKNEKRI